MKKQNFLNPNKTFIIAEVGSNHNQSLAKAKKLIKLSAEIGADAVKFQYLNYNEMYTNEKIFKKEKKIFNKISFPENWIPKLNQYAKKNKIIFFFSITSFVALRLAIKYNISLLKIASPQFFSNPWLAEASLKTKKKVILSSGLSTFKEIKKRIKFFKKKKCLKNAYLLVCDSKYPLEIEEFNYKKINDFKKEFKIPIGLSDHTTSTIVPSLAVMNGANIIEKHITLNKLEKGPDHFFSLNIKEFSQMIKNIRETEKIIYSKKNKKRKLNTYYRRFYQVKCIANKNYNVHEKIKGIKKNGLRAMDGIDIEKAELIENNYIVKKLIKKGDVIKYHHLKKI